MPQKILITDAYSTMTLSFLKSLANENYDIFVGGSSNRSLTFYSRYAKNKVVYPSYLKDIDGFISSIAESSIRNSIDYIIPLSESSIEILSGTEMKFGAARVVSAPRNSIEIAMDKSLLCILASELGICYPKTLPIDSRSFSRFLNDKYLKSQLKDASLNFPLILKWAKSERIVNNRIMVNERTRYFVTFDELAYFIKRFSYSDKNVLLQEFVSGQGYGCSGLAKNGEARVLFCHKRIRESTPTGGPSAVAEAVHPFDDIVEPARAIVKALNWFGPFMLEFKKNRDHNYLIEMNGRLWGSYPLAIKAGLNIPLLFIKMIEGNDFREYEYQVGVRGRWFWSDVKSLYLSVKGKPKSWPGQFPPRSRMILDFVRDTFDRRTFMIDFDICDPLPFMARLLARNIKR